MSAGKKHKYMALIMGKQLRRDSAAFVEAAATRCDSEFLGSRFAANGDLQVGYSCTIPNAVSIETILDGHGLKPWSFKDYGEDDGRRGKTTRADTSKLPAGDEPKKTAKPKVKAVKVTKDATRPESPANPTVAVEIRGVKPTPKRKAKAETPKVESSPVSDDAVLVPLKDAFKKWSDIGSKDHERAVRLLGQGCEESVMLQWGKFTIDRGALVRVIHGKLAKEFEGDAPDTELRDAFKALSFNSTITQLDPFIKLAFGKDADFIHWHTCHSK